MWAVPYHYHSFGSDYPLHPLVGRDVNRNRRRDVPANRQPFPLWPGCERARGLTGGV